MTLWTRAAYRARQFFHALGNEPDPADLAAARKILAAPQMDLFTRLHPSEQTHALQVMRNLEALPPDEGRRGLLTAALLHDVGKARHPLRLWERVAGVVGRALAPKFAAKSSRRPPQGLARPFVVAAHHPAWGAEMAAACGASPLALALIRRHQDPPSSQPPASLEDRLLALLQSADDRH